MQRRSGTRGSTWARQGMLHVAREERRFTKAWFLGMAHSTLAILGLCDNAVLGLLATLQLRTQHTFRFRFPCDHGVPIVYVLSAVPADYALPVFHAVHELKAGHALKAHAHSNLHNHLVPTPQMAGKGRNTSFFLGEIEAEEAKKRCKVEEVAEMDAKIKKMREDYKRMCQFDEQLKTLQNNLWKTRLSPMDATNAVQKCFQDAKE
eukprot:maker-scaffold494_size155699-snap-gene-0.19 protein:Tk10271 transcript:maker-scaffold494_size155699-snap-gene-0.19-mRNA-1 annotation:"type 4 fimbrial biogenesis protein"